MTANPYFSPEAFGFTQIALIEDTELLYEFDILVVWREDVTGHIYAAADRGCSCPTPFEDVEIKRLHSIAEFDVLVADLRSPYSRWSVSDIQEARRLVASALAWPQSGPVPA